MPTYAYACRDCGARTEIFQRMSDDPLTTCAACGGVLRRVLFPVGVVYKGSGFYVTDYARKSGGNGSGNGKGEANNPKSESGAASKKEETSAAAAD